jgi:outer membrane protein TolC
MRFSGLKIRSPKLATRRVAMMVLAICLLWMGDSNYSYGQEPGDIFQLPNDLPTKPDWEVSLYLPVPVIPDSNPTGPSASGQHQKETSVPSSTMDAHREPDYFFQISHELPTVSSELYFHQPDPDNGFPLAPSPPNPGLLAPPQPPIVAEPWWSALSLVPLRPETQPLPVNLDTLFALTAAHSGRVQAVAQAPWVSQSQLEQAQAAFDPTLFSNNRFNSTSDPVENELVTGGPPRLEDNIVSSDSGLRVQNQLGSSYQIGQRFGHKNSNSLFFDPQDQGTARLYANVTQPLMRGRKIDINRSLVLTAQFETKSAQAEFQTALQKQLFQVADTYWLLYTERVSLLQGRQHLARASEIATLLQAREGYDSPNSQVLRARATVANRTAQLAQADARIKNLESRLRALVNAPELINNRNAEFLPLQLPKLHPIGFVIEHEVGLALHRRPELKDLFSKLEVAKVRLQLARDQTKPTLNLVGEGYVAGLQGQSDIPGAFVDQFSEGRPGYAAGLVYERPVRNQASTATVRQRQYEVIQLSHLINEATENVRAEVETAVRNVEAARQSVMGRQMSLDAANMEVNALKDRWLTLGNDPQLGQLQLNDLLGSQDRLLQEEQNLLQALVEYNRSILEVQRATGVLVQFVQ